MPGSGAAAGAVGRSAKGIVSTPVAVTGGQSPSRIFTPVSSAMKARRSSGRLVSKGT